MQKRWRLGVDRHRVAGANLWQIVMWLDLSSSSFTHLRSNFGQYRVSTYAMPSGHIGAGWGGAGPGLAAGGWVVSTGGPEVVSTGGPEEEAPGAAAVWPPPGRETAHRLASCLPPPQPATKARLPARHRLRPMKGSRDRPAPLRVEAGSRLPDEQGSPAGRTRGPAPAAGGTLFERRITVTLW